MVDAVTKPGKTRKRKWAEMALDVFCGLTLGVLLVIYSGIKKISGNKLPDISHDVKRGAIINKAKKD